MRNNQPFETVVSEHGAMVLRVCRAVLGPHADADDAWSEVFLTALKAWPELPANTNMKAWLITVAHRKAIDVIRQRQRQAIPLENPPEQSSPTPDSFEERFEVWEILKGFPPKQRQAVAYHYLADLSYREIANLIGGTPEAARRAAADGIKKLRQHPSLTEQTPEGDFS